MKLKIALALAWSIFVLAAHGEKIALTGGTLIRPGAEIEIIEPNMNSTLVIDGDRIAAIGPKVLPPHTRVVDCKGKFILPGYIDTHIHFFQSGDLFTRPDIVDLTKVRSYSEEVAWVKSHLPDVFSRYLRSGITSVVDVGGPFWNFEVRKVANATGKAPRVAVAGPLISSVSRQPLDLGDPPIVKIDTPDQAREFVRKLAEQKPDLVKIWYIVDKDHPVESFRPIVRATVEESHAHKLRVAVHATELETARAAIEEGADVLVHSVIDKPVDDSFVKLLKDRHTILCPTLVVFERYGRTFANKLNLTPEEKAWGKPDETLDRIKKTYDVAFKNLKILEDAGVTIAAGTDAGNIGTIHGPALFREFQLMKEAGLTAMQILQCATVNAAKVFDTTGGMSFRSSAPPKIGAIVPGNFADL